MLAHPAELARAPCELGVSSVAFCVTWHGVAAASSLPSSMKQFFLLIACLLLGLASAQSRLAFIDGDGQLATMAADGSDLRTLTAREDEIFQFPAWSPLDDRIAVIGASRDGGTLYLAEDSDAGVLEPLYTDGQQAPFYLYWSPDASTISFLANHPEANIALHLADIAAGESRVHALGNPFYWQWSADAQDMFVHTGLTGDGAKLTFLGTEPAGDDALANTENVDAPGLFRAPGLSASGDYLAYAKRNPVGISQVIIQNHPDNNDPINRELNHEGLSAFAWSPTRDLLAITSPEIAAPHSFGPLRLIDAATGELETLTDDTVLAFFWSPDGQHLAYITPVRARGDGVASSKEMFYAQAPNILFDVLVVDVDTLESRYLYSFTPTQVFVGQFLPFFDQYALSHRVWSPNSDALVLSVVEDGQAQVAVVPLDGSPQLVGEGTMPFWRYY